MKNVFKNTNYSINNFDKLVHVNNKNMFMAQIFLSENQLVPKHKANADVVIILLNGKINVEIEGTKNELEEGSLFEVKNLSSMEIFNLSKQSSFLIIKTPNPNL